MKHTLKLFYRNFRKNLTVNLINIGGLSLSMAVVLMLSAYCYSELMTDRHHDKVDQTFLISSSHKYLKLGVVTPGVLADHLQYIIPEVQKVVRLAGTWNPPVVKHENGESFQTNLMFADDGFFDVFKYIPTFGDLSAALKEPMSAVVTSSEAIRLFGKTDVVGQNLIINNEYLVTITAVIEEGLNNSFLTFNILLPVSSIPQIPIIDSDFTNWNNSYCMTFVQLENGTETKKTATIIKNIFYDNSDKAKSPEAPDITLLPTKEIYFAGIDNSYLDFIVVGDKSKVIVLLMVALLIFLMAIINYTNISSYALKDRLHQTGIFKIVGAGRIQLLRNNIFEAILTFTLSVWLALMLTEILRPVVYYFTGMKYANNLIFSPSFITVSLFVAVLCGILSNISNALKISDSPPIHSIRKKFNAGNNKGRYQGTLVVIQFCAAISLISFTLLVNRQIEFGGKDLGFAKENILAIKFTNQLKKEVLREKLNSLSNIDKISLTGFYPGKSFSQWQGSLSTDGEEKYVRFTTFDADAHFMDMMSIELISGRNFSDTILSDKNKVLVNESFLKEYDVTLPIGETINKKYEIIGVVKDFHFKSKNHAIGPLVLLNRGYATYALVSTHTENFKELSRSVDNIKDICAKMSPDFPVEISFMDMAVANMYQAEIQFQRTFTFFAGCAIFLSCLGILALSLFAGQQRTKEIGIRKVNGAHVEDILMLLNKDFIKWVVIAFVIATPIAFFSMKKWLESFAYKTEISWWIFIVGGGMALLIALFTVSWQSWMAARRNPVEALRYE